MSTSKRERSDHAVDNANKKQRLTADPKISAKITNLMHAIQEVLYHGDDVHNQDGGVMKDYIGLDAYEHLSELQNSLNWHAAADGMLSTYRARYPTTPKMIVGITVAPWKASEIPPSPKPGSHPNYPPLPKILDRTLETAVFTHQGTNAGRVGDLSYERLEWVGDSYLELTCTLLIAKTFPFLSPGKSSQLRERCVKNITLASYARYYNFDQRARIPEEILISKHATKDQDMTKIMGDIFEAYVAAVVLSDPEHGIIRIVEWLRVLWSIELRNDIIEAEKKGSKYDSPMWNLRGDAGVADILSADRVELGPKEQLQKLVGAKGIKLTYKEVAPVKKDKSNKLPLFTIGLYLDGYGKKDLQLGYGKGNGKKDAGKRAAEMALGDQKLMKELTDQKKLLDAQLEREREALQAFA